MASLHGKAPTDLTKTLKVIGAGHPRTGTSSFVLALEILYQSPALHTGSGCLSHGEGKLELRPNDDGSWPCSVHEIVAFTAKQQDTIRSAVGE
jgi:hypothetical protein